MPTHVVALRERSVRASSPKFVGPAAARLGLLVSRGSLWLSVSSAPPDLAAKTRAVRKRRCAHGLGQESVGQSRSSLALPFSALPAPSDLVTKTRALAELRLEHGLSRAGQSSQLVAGASRRRAAPRKVFDEPLRGCSSRAGANRAGVHIFGSQVGLAAYAWRISSPTPMSLSLHRPPQANPSVNLRANGMPPGPSRRYAVHFLQLGPGVTPSSPGYLER